MNDIGEAWARHARADFQGAADLSRDLLAKSPNDPAALTCNAMSNWQLGGDLDRCIADVRRAISLAPREGWILHNLATVLASSGELEEARACFTKAIELKPDDTQAFYGLTQNQKFTEETDLIRHMLFQYSGGQLSKRAREYVCFGLAKAYADLGLHKRAIHFCIEGNWVTQRPYDVERSRSDLSELRGLVAQRAFRQLDPGSAQIPERPVFVVGMPRSGTTLVETILSRHPEVHAGGELTHIANVETALLEWARANRGHTGGSYEMLKHIPGEYFTRNARAVLKRVKETAAGTPFSVFTDKLPDNSQRLGLISLLFPKARIIYVRRHPLDCCISALFLHFARGNGFAFRQDLLGERYRQVAETMQLWKEGLSLPILDVNYESLVTDPEPVIRRMIAFAGLEWDDACLHPEQAGRRILTSNQYQVRQPINRRSIGRWREYEEWIQPLISALGGHEWIENERREMSAALAA
ncbi:MAG TPA: sulfotransferase [Devosiaceae bacterium]|nr:sulfotransferase [Devosiaceae bacterium]